MNINELTMAEVGIVEQKSGLPFSALSDDEKPKGVLLQALAYVIKKREDSKYTFADAGRLSFAEVNALIAGDDDDDADEGKEKDES